MKCENKYETEAWEEHLTYVLGLDEAGRGPIAGPLVVAGVCFPKHFEHEGIYDSKKISEKKREEMFEIIIQEAVYYKIEVVDVEIIDTYNIYRATQMTMEKIVNEFKECEKALSDAMPLPNVVVPYEAIVKGDQKSVSIAAASILAKVTRDRIMKEYDEIYPEYGFKNHKGYPTKKHIEALEKFGVLPIHRKSFSPVSKLSQMKFDL